MNEQNKRMLQGPLLSGILLYTIPIILTSVLQLLFNAADLVVVGRFCGSISLAAVGATGSITTLIVNLFIGFSVGVGVNVAHAIGAKMQETVHRVVHTAIPTALVCGIVLTVIGVSCAAPMLRLMGTPENVLPLSTVYMRYYFCGMTFNMLYNFAASILRAAGDTRSPLIYLTLAGIINVILNLIFVLVFDMNVAGVALATVISQAFSAVFLLRTLCRRTDACRLVFSKIRFHKSELVRIVRIGLPAGIQGSLFSISNVLVQSSINSFGQVVMSGNAAAQNIEGFVYTTMNAFYQTTVNFTGQNVGARQFRRVLKIIGVCLGCQIVIGGAACFLACTFSSSLLSIYITDSAEAISYGMLRLSIVCSTYVLCGIMEVSTGALRGMGASFAPMVISILGVCGIRIGWVMTVFQLPKFHTPNCLYLSYPISWAVTFLIQISVFLHLFKRQTGSLLGKQQTA